MFWDHLTLQPKGISVCSCHLFLQGSPLQTLTKHTNLHTIFSQFFKHFNILTFKQLPTCCIRSSSSYKQVSVQLPTSADKRGSVRICCCAPCCGADAADRQPTDRAVIDRSPGRWVHMQQQTRSSGVRRPDGTDGHDIQTDGRTDARQLHRPCCAYYAGSANNA